MKDASDEFRFAEHDKNWPAADDQGRLDALAACIANQQKSGFGNYLDVREMKCGCCGSSGFNTGWGFFEFACGATQINGDDDGGDPCPRLKVLEASDPV
jgi:hypothetical protein